jgi:hypothetical protein
MSERATGSSGKRRLAIVGITTVGVTALVAVLAFAALALHVRPAYGSGTGPGGCYGTTTTGPACTVKGHQAYADFSSIGSDGCTYTDTFIQVFDSVTTPGKTASQMVLTGITQYDCSGNLVESAYNTDPNTFAPNFTGSIQFGSGVSTATVNGTAVMYDSVTGAQFTSTINVTWKGYGPTTTYIDSSIIRSPGFYMNNHFHGSSRQAEASGVITDASGTNLATPATLNASLDDGTSGTVQISRQ